MAEQQEHAQAAEPVIFQATARPCPCCSVYSMGWPVETDGGFTTEEWPEPWRWIFRMDLRGFVCGDCHRTLGPDRVREKMIRDIESRTALVPRAHFQPPLFQRGVAA